MSERRVWKCRSCKKQFSVLTGTMMHATKVPVRTWILVIFDMMADKNGMSAREVERKYGVTSKRRGTCSTASVRRWAVRTALATMTGTIVADETWIGGDPKNRHANKRARDRQQGSRKRLRCCPWSTP